MQALKYASSIVLLALCIFVPQGSFFDGCGHIGHWTYHFSHANLFHLLINFIYIRSFRPRWTTILVSYFVASAVSYVPLMAMSLPTCGISAMCFAMQARHDVAWRVLNWRLLAFNMAFALVPNVNWKIHLGTYITAFVIWTIFYRARSGR